MYWFIFTLISFCLNVIEAASWDRLKTLKGPHPRHEAGSVLVGNKLFLLLGRGERPIEYFATDNQKWISTSTYTTDLHHSQPVYFRKEIWIPSAFTGQFVNCGETAITHILKYNVEKDEMYEGPEIPKKFRRGSAGVAIYNNKFYLSGGINGGHGTCATSYPYFDEYDPVLNIWTRMESQPTYKRDHYFAVVLGENFVLASGRDSAQENVWNHTVDPVEIYNFKTKEWRLGKSIPTKRAGAMAVAVDEQKVIIAGGEFQLKKPASKNVEIYDITKDEWKEMAKFNQGRHGAGIWLYDNKLYTSAGCGKGGGRPEIDSTETLTLPPKIVIKNKQKIFPGIDSTETLTLPPKIVINNKQKIFAEIDSTETLTLPPKIVINNKQKIFAINTGDSELLAEFNTREFLKEKVAFVHFLVFLLFCLVLIYFIVFRKTNKRIRG